MLTDLSVVEQRYKAVLEVLESDANVTDVAIHDVSVRLKCDSLHLEPHPASRVVLA